MQIEEVVDGTGLKGVATAPSRRVALLELVIGYGLMLVVIWTPGRWQVALSLVPVVFLLGTMWRHFRGWASMGMRRKNLGRSSWVVALSACIAGFSVYVAARLGTLHAPETMALFLRTYLGYAIWSFVQQLLLLDFFLGRLLQLVRSKAQAVVGTAGVFALAHLPNPVLTPVTLVFGVVTCLIFLHYRNLYILGVSHAILGIAVACTFPGHVTHNMRVGLGYVRYQPEARMQPANQRALAPESGPQEGSIPGRSIQTGL